MARASGAGGGWWGGEWPELAEAVCGSRGRAYTALIVGPTKVQRAGPGVVALIHYRPPTFPPGTALSIGPTCFSSIILLVALEKWLIHYVEHHPCNSQSIF